MSTTCVELQLTNGEYHQPDGVVSNTGKEVFRRSQMTYYGQYVAMTLPFQPPTPALQLGSWAHVAILEPDDWASKYVCGLDGIDRRTKAGKEAEAAFMEAADGKHVVPFELYCQVAEMRRACRDNVLVRTLLDRDGDVEHSYKWLDESGLWLKSRPDKTFASGYDDKDVIMDLKTTDDASPSGFEYACRSHGYHRTAAFRIDGHRARTGNDSRYLFVAVSKKTFEVGLYELQSAEIELGRKENRAILNRMARCYETGDWQPEWSKRVMSLAYPAWAFKDSDSWEVCDD